MTARHVSVTLLAHYALAASCASTSTSAADHDIDHGIPSRGYPDQGWSTHALGYLDIGTKGYHLAWASRLLLQSKHPRRDIFHDAQATTVGEWHYVGYYLRFLSSLTIRDVTVVHVNTTTTLGEC
jgi:hypothetical protein